MMIREVKGEAVATLIGRCIRQGQDEQAEAIHFELKEHFLVIRLRWGSRMRMLWRGPRSEGVGVMAYLKAAAGMRDSGHGVQQVGVFSFVDQGQSLGLPAICKPYLSGQKMVLSLPCLSREAARPAV